ncbi:spore coat protein U domain-containing protein [Morganella morganii]|uniref:spore coat protein U domain-containing protein n=1 Tax=Morganella morganii TaxID=582 RepID=UPI00046AB284|nr:spore coat protein U domain-containing protein [Morganella morganii]
MNKMTTTLKSERNFYSHMNKIKYYIFITLSLSHLSYADNITLISPGEMKKFPIIINENAKSGNYNNDVNWFGTLSKVDTSRLSISCDKNIDPSGWSSDHKVFGLKYDNDIIISFDGSIGGVAGNDVLTYSGSWIMTPYSDQINQQNYSKSCSTYKLGGFMNIYQPTNKAFVTKQINGSVILYVGPQAIINSDTNINAYITYPGIVVPIFSSVVRVTSPRECTVSTDNTITFPQVDVTNEINSHPMTNKSGNLTITCNDTSNAPVNIEIQGKKGRYSDTMALTMSDGDNAPAEVRGFIGTDIPLNGQCNGRNDGYKGVVHFVPNGGLEKLSLKPGTNKYNWVLCSTGEYKTGKATGSAKMIISWD